MTPILSDNFAMKSTLQKPDMVLLAVSKLDGRGHRLATIYRWLAFMGLGCVTLPIPDTLRALLLGLVLPGAGHLLWASPEGLFVSATLSMGWLAIFAVAMAVWFGTGNVLAPLGAWLFATISGATAGFGLLATMPSASRETTLALLFTFGIPLAANGLWWKRPLTRRVAKIGIWQPQARLRAPVAELSTEDGERIRLLLDRALQPVESFNGFERRDQFQTAALRYQINFASYAVSIVQASYLPAFQGYLLEAQQRLLAKQSDRRIWSYWALENAWGNLRLDPDPIAHENIMYSGFTGTQIALAEAASGKSVVGDGIALDLRHPDGRRFAYTARAINECLADQYRDARFGLLACEPNWIYPLCNAITATGIRAHDAQNGTDRWAEIAPGFRRALERDFTAARGGLIPFRSSLTGWAPPSLGGAVMDAFPSLFLNCLFPDLAGEHWERLRTRLSRQVLPRAFWPIDVGNYGFSRASSYAASAAAAVEMGDHDTAGQLLELLDAACPAVTIEGVRHRPRASLWAHALEIMARHGRTNGLRDLVSNPPAAQAGPRLATATYSQVFVAAATANGSTLRLVIHGAPTGVDTKLGFAGLIPERFYRLEGNASTSVRADGEGKAEIELAVAGRCELNLLPMV